LRTRAGNRGGLVLRRGNNWWELGKKANTGWKKRFLILGKGRRESMKSPSHLPQGSRNLTEPTNLGPCGVSRG
jgi:hypothetical protein